MALLVSQKVLRQRMWTVACDEMSGAAGSIDAVATDEDVDVDKSEEDVGS